MTIPKAIPIERAAGHRTKFAGTWARGQFLGNVLSQTDPVAWADGDRVNSQRWFAYLHEFDPEGRYLESTVKSPGIGEAARQEARRLLQEWLEGIPGRVYGDIAIQPFRFEHDGILFGLVIEDGHGRDWVELYPDRLGFYEPWDGKYDT
jgi:formate hydrogenlyase regulatory protein HycA